MGVRSDPAVSFRKNIHTAFLNISISARPDSILDGINIYDARIRAGKARPLLIL